MSAVRGTKDCSVCGKLLDLCHCPWNRPFEFWPRRLLNTVQAMVVGGPHED
jgi:hypothetical protein